MTIARVTSRAKLPDLVHLTIGGQHLWAFRLRTLEPAFGFADANGFEPVGARVGGRRFLGSYARSTNGVYIRCVFGQPPSQAVPASNSRA